MTTRGAGSQAALRYVIGIVAVQACWLLSLFVAGEPIWLAVFLLCLSLLHARLHADEPLMRIAFPVTIAMVLLAIFSPAPIHLIAVLLAALVTTSVISGQRTSRR